MVSPSSSRVSLNTPLLVNEKIRYMTDWSLAYHEKHPEEIESRLRELDREWDIERVLETGSSSVSLLGLILGVTHKRRWLLLPLAVQGFFLQHAIQGWCPPLPVFRRLGFRTSDEIAEERNELLKLVNRKGEPDVPRLRI